MIAECLVDVLSMLTFFGNQGKMDGCVFGWHLLSGFYHAGIMVSWNPQRPEHSIICHFGLYGGKGFPWNLTDDYALQVAPEGRLETIEAAWKRWLIPPRGKTLYFNQNLRVDPQRLAELQAMIPMIPSEPEVRSLQLAINRRYNLFRNNCQWFSRSMLPEHVQPYVVTQSDRAYVRAHAPRLQGNPPLPLRLQPGQVMITEWTHSIKM